MTSVAEVTDLVESIRSLKWQCVGQRMKREERHWTKTLLDRNQSVNKQSQEKPKKDRWDKDVKQKAGANGTQNGEMSLKCTSAEQV